MTSKSDRNDPWIRARMDYGFARARDLAFDAVTQLWRVRQTNGMKQTELAQRLGRDTGWLSKKLSGPGNWTLRTLGEMAEALDGEIEIRIHPLEEPLPEKPNYNAYDDGPEQDRIERLMRQKKQGVGEARPALMTVG